MSHAFRILNQAMPIVAAALGRKFGVPVAVGGSEACTDGHSIQVPALPAHSQLIPVAWGYLAHEAAHLRFTDFDTYREGVAGADPFTRSLLNILEDIRVEQAIAMPYPGTRESLLAVSKHLTERGALSAPTPTAHPAQVLCNYLLLHLRHRVLQSAILAAPALAAEQSLRQVFPARTVHRLQGLLTEAGHLNSTAQTLHLARRIRALLEEEEQQSAHAPSSAAQAGTEQSQESGQSTPARAETDTRVPEPSAGTPEAGAPAAPQSHDPTASEPGSQNAAEHCRSPQPSVTPPAEAEDTASKAHALSQTLNATESDLPGDLFEQVRKLLGSEGHGSSACQLPRGEPYLGHPTAGLHLLAAVQQESRRLRARLQGLVQAARQDRPHALRQGSHVLPKRIYRTAVGDPRVFARKRERVAVDTAIHLLIDLSGSMSTPVRRSNGVSQERAVIAQSAALALALALDGIHGVSVAVSAFPDLCGEEDSISVLVSHGQRPRARAGAFLQDPRGSTPMAGALWFAAADLLGQAQSRRIVLLLTDGKPDQITETREILRLCQNAGLETVGIGIGVDVADLFPVALRIDDAMALRSALFGAAERLLLAA